MSKDWCPKEFKRQVDEIDKSFEPVGMVHKDQYGYGASLKTGMEHGTKLYTHPKLLKSLTNDEIQAIQDNTWVVESFDTREFNTFKFARAIEKALKDKNT